MSVSNLQTTYPVIWALSFLIILLPGLASAHGKAAMEEDSCVQRVGGNLVHFNAYQPQNVDGTFPLYITCGVSSYLYAQTRLPLYSQATSFPLVAAVVGPMFILPNVGLNEWGHAFWFVDELFAAPLHWGFVTLGWCGLFGAAGGVAAQIVSRMSNLADVIWNNAPKSILDPFPSQVGTGAKTGY